MILSIILLFILIYFLLSMWSAATIRDGCWTWIWVSDWSRKWLVDFNAGKTQLVLFGQYYNSGVLMRKCIGMFLRKNHTLRWYGCLYLLHWIMAFTLSHLPKLLSRKLKPGFVLWAFFLLRLICVSINLPYGLAWNTVVMSGLVLIAATWKC